MAVSKSVWVIVTDFGATPVGMAATLSILDGMCPEWREQIGNKRFRNKKVKAARKFMADLETTVKTINYIMWVAGRDPLPVI